MQDHPYGRRQSRYDWPHYDNRGPDYYYENEPRHAPRPREYEYFPPYHDRQEERFRNDSDIYEDEFEYRRRDDYRPYDERHDRWPEDEFYYNRRELHPPGNFFERGVERLRSAWNDFRGRPGGYDGRYPEDHHEKYYGRDNHSRNANRGRPPRRPYSY